MCHWVWLGAAVNTLHLQWIYKRINTSAKVFLFSALIMHTFFHKSIPIYADSLDNECSNILKLSLKKNLDVFRNLKYLFRMFFHNTFTWLFTNYLVISRKLFTHFNVKNLFTHRSSSNVVSLKAKSESMGLGHNTTQVRKLTKKDTLCSVRLSYYCRNFEDVNDDKWNIKYVLQFYPTLPPTNFAILRSFQSDFLTK